VLTTQPAGGQTRVTALVSLLDAFGTLRSARLVYVPVERLPGEPPADLTTLRDSRSLELRLNPPMASGQFLIPVAGDIGLAWQVGVGRPGGGGGGPPPGRTRAGGGGRPGGVPRRSPPPAPARRGAPAPRRARGAPAERDPPAADPKAAGELAERLAAEASASAK